MMICSIYQEISKYNSLKIANLNRIHNTFNHHNSLNNLLFKNYNNNKIKYKTVLIMQIILATHNNPLPNKP